MLKTDNQCKLKTYVFFHFIFPFMWKKIRQRLCVILTNNLLYISAHAEGHGFMPQLGYTKNQHKMIQTPPSLPWRSQFN